MSTITPGNTEEPADTPPIVFIATPLIIFVLVGVIATIFRMRRRNRLRAEGLWPTHEPHMGTHGGPTTRRIAADGPWIPVVVRGGGGGTRTRGAAGAARGRNADGSLAVSPDEGLNELGEAPPPYDPKAKSNTFKDIELGDLERDVGVANPPGYGVVGTRPAHMVQGTGERPFGSNNPYTSLEQAGQGSELRTPPPAVTR